MAESIYVTPEDGNGTDALPESGEAQQAAKTEQATLDEINAKLDAILAALSGRES